MRKLLNRTSCGTGAVGSPFICMVLLGVKGIGSVYAVEIFICFMLSYEQLGEV